MAYTKRTCHKCGFRGDQPNMQSVTIEYNSGSSEAALSKRSVAASLFGNDKGANQVINWATGSSKRQYKRTKKTWECASVGCATTSGSISYSAGGFVSKLFRGIFQAFLMVVFVFVLLLIFV